MASDFGSVNRENTVVHTERFIYTLHLKQSFILICFGLHFSCVQSSTASGSCTLLISICRSRLMGQSVIAYCVFPLVHAASVPNFML